MSEKFEQFLRSYGHSTRLNLDHIHITENTAQQSASDVQLLKFFLHIKKPKKILEIGVALGGGTLHIFNESTPEAELYSVDYYKHLATFDGAPQGMEIGEDASKAYDQNIHPRWTKLFGYDISECIEKIGSGVDFVVLDTAHIMPGEILSFLAILPFLEDRCVLLIHDISWHTIGIQQETKENYVQHGYCTSLLISSILSQFKFFNASRNIPNMGAVVIEKETVYKNIFSIMNTLFVPWYYIPNKRIIQNTATIIKKYYPPYVIDLYMQAVKYNFKLTKNRTSAEKKEKIREFLEK